MADDNKQNGGYKPIVFRKEVMYDINSLPTNDMGFNQEKVFKTVMEYYKDSGILLYDASRGLAPVFNDKDLKK